MTVAQESRVARCVQHVLALATLAVPAFGCSSCSSVQVNPTDPSYEPGTGGAYWETPGGAGGQGGTQPAATGGNGTEVTTCDWVPARSVGRSREATPRVVGGSVSPTLYPGIAALETPSGFQFCGCVLVASDRCVSAAHCQVEPGDVVHAGTLDLRYGGVRAVVKEARHHPDWHSTGSGWDIAVLHLVTPLDVSTAELRPDAPAVGEIVWEVGWGATSEGSGTTPVLRHGRLPIFDWTACQLVYGTLTSTDLCAGGLGVDGCQGDSGGPLYDSQNQVVGITSRGLGCGRPGIPGIWTAVSKVHEWVTACLG